MYSPSMYQNPIKILNTNRMGKNRPYTVPKPRRATIGVFPFRLLVGGDGGYEEADEVVRRGETGRAGD